MNLVGHRRSGNFKIAGFSKVRAPRAKPKFTVKNSSRFVGAWRLLSQRDTELASAVGSAPMRGDRYSVTDCFRTEADKSRARSKRHRTKKSTVSRGPPRTA